MPQTILLPEGHDWQEYDTGDAMSYAWLCEVCGAAFTVTNDQDGSVETEFVSGADDRHEG